VILTRAKAKAAPEPRSDRAWPADKVERRPIASLVAYAKNARTHSPEQIKALAASIAEWGWTMPILLDEAGGIIAGHGRVLAAKKLGIEDAPCMVAIGWTEAQKKAYRIADNQLAIAGSGWDNELLKLEFGELKGLGFDLALTGFTLGEIKGIFEGGDEDETYTTELKTPAYTPKGDAPRVSELFDDTKSRLLRAEIHEAELPPDLAAFMLKAADRHTVFDFHRIADFYANAAPGVQRLMEKSALVIIDFDSAIQNGFVRLNDRLAEMASDA